MPFCRYFTALYIRNAECDLSPFSHKKVPNFKKKKKKTKQKKYTKTHTTGTSMK